MSEQPKETLSALMDNEVSDFELRRLVQQVADSDELSQQWQRYHLASSVMKQEQFGSGDISASVMAAIDDEPAHQAAAPAEQVQPTGMMTSFLKPLASMAVAASVTAVVILGGQNFGLGNPPAEIEQVAQAPVNSVSQPVFNRPSDFMRAQFGSPRAVPQGTDSEADIIRLNRGLNNYIRQHQSLVRAPQLQTQPGWIPEGFKPVKNALAPAADLTVFSNGSNAFTVSIERAANQSVPEGATQVGEMVAVGKKVDQYFVTVVGDVPLMVADRIVNSVGKIQ